MGENGYAALNVLTDFASRPIVLSFSPASRVHLLQERSGRWVDEFIAAIKDEAFDFGNYVKDYLPVAEAIRTA